MQEVLMRTTKPKTGNRKKLLEITDDLKMAPFGFGCGCGCGSESNEKKKEVIREVVMIPCKYFGTLFPQTCDVLPKLWSKKNRIII